MKIRQAEFFKAMGFEGERFKFAMYKYDVLVKNLKFAENKVLLLPILEGFPTPETGFDILDHNTLLTQRDLYHMPTTEKVELRLDILLKSLHKTDL